MLEEEKRAKEEEGDVTNDERDEDVCCPSRKIKLGEKHVQMTKYNGDSTAEVLPGWIRNLDTYFACEETTEHARLNFVPILLSKSTTLWHQTQEVQGTMARNMGTVQATHQREISIT